MNYMQYPTTNILTDLLDKSVQDNENGCEWIICSK